MSSKMDKALFFAILSLDAYNQGYGKGIKHRKTKIGPASIITDAEKKLGSNNIKEAGFYAVAYKLDKAVDDLHAGTIIVTYRGTDSLLNDDYTGGSDIPGWMGGGGGRDGSSAPRGPVLSPNRRGKSF